MVSNVTLGGVIIIAVVKPRIQLATKTHPETLVYTAMNLPGSHAENLAKKGDGQVHAGNLRSTGIKNTGGIFGNRDVGPAPQPIPKTATKKKSQKRVPHTRNQRYDYKFKAPECAHERPRTLQQPPKPVNLSQPPVPHTPQPADSTIHPLGWAQGVY
ncbi:hypothetical protein BS47DRAFT_1365142 [Hydnum rufescens UP504]|uniref:Uncharacterized protein n=1 Tax=Hydnum rufescens UP504 TaxID=1448309 RepID=A0A9P6ARK3_9AGAM|nr:hypothetical protein BS47DRAFT_1365142 [Hydnum rufescens UP504]